MRGHVCAPLASGDLSMPSFAGMLKAKPAWARVWHLWQVIIPRRSITGRLVHGQVLRRHDGRKWIYKKFDRHRPAKID